MAAFLTGVAALLAALVAATVVAPTASAAPAVTPRPLAKPGGGTATPPPSPVSAPSVADGFGIFLPDVPGDMSELDSTAAALGRRPDTVMWYAAWASVPDFPSAAAQAVTDRGATPVITWEPWDPAAGATQRGYTLARIASGRLDGYLTRWAQQAAAWGKPVTLRFAHEMNGTWYPWAEGVNGNQPGDYVRAWRHVVGVFRAAGATNVSWSWSPNVPYPGSTVLPGLFPGDAYVDEVSLDGYNWAGILPDTTWQGFWQVFADGLAQLDALSDRPMTIGEVGCPEAGGDKAAWVADMFVTLSAHPEVAGFTWFSVAKEADWRVDSSPATLQAFVSGLATYA